VAEPQQEGFPGAEGLGSSQESTLPTGNETAGSNAGLRTEPDGRDTEARFEAGDPIGRFTVTRVLGEGGMGVVYGARDPELGRELAVKLLHQSLDDEDERARARLLREARAMAQVAHPNLVTIYDVGRHEGRVFIAMELVPGQTLGEWRASGDRGWREIVGMYRAAGEGLLAAHEEGLVHRDFKPSNVLLSGKGRVQVLDFGLARAATHAGDAAPTGTARPPTASTDEALSVDLTRTGALVGTPAYMAPEQFKGEATDARTDQFSFCVALWEALFGRRPFEGDSPVALMFSVIEGRRRPPPERTEVPPEIVEALQTGLHSQPDRRFSGMRPLLDRLRESEPSTAPAKPWRGWWLAAALGVTAITGALVWGLRPEASEVDPIETVKAPEVGLSALEGYRTREDFRSTATLWRTAERDFVRACEEAPDHVRWCAAVHFCQGQALLESHEAELAEQQLRLATTIDPSWALPYIGLGGALRLQGRLDEAMDASITAQGLAPKLWVAVSSAASTHVAADRLDDAIDEYLRALDLAPDHPEILADLALVYHARGLDSQAERYAAAALAHDPNSMPALMLLAERALEEGEGASALDYADRAVAEGPQSVSAWLGRADALLMLAKEQQARESFTRAVELIAIDPDHGAPPLRLAQVQEALARDELPLPRYGEGRLEEHRSKKVHELAEADEGEDEFGSEPEPEPEPRPERSKKATPARRPRAAGQRAE